MASILLSGPAGAAKSAMAAELLAEWTGGPVVLADFQAILVAVTGVVHGPDGRYPLRDERLLPLVEYVRRAILTAARNRDIAVIATNSDGNAARRALLLDELGEGASERIADPGRPVVAARLSDAATGTLSPECSSAINRWYGRL